MFTLEQIDEIHHRFGNADTLSQYLIINFIDIPNQEIIASLLGALDQSESETEKPITPLIKRYYINAETQARKKLGNEAFDAAFAEGQKMSLDEALDQALKMIDDS